MLCRHRNLSANTLIFVGTIPLATYHAPSAPPDGDYSKSPEAGFVIPSTNTALPPLPESNLYPNLRKIGTIINIFRYKENKNFDQYTEIIRFVIASLYD